MSENNLINIGGLYKKSLDNAMEFITHEIEMHPISSWSEEVDTEQGKEDNVANNGQQISCTSVITNADLEKRVFADLEQFNSKIEIGQKVKLIVHKHGVNVNRLSQDMKDALKTYKSNGETKEDMYKCTFCDYTSKRKYNVKRHEKAMHYYYE